MNFKEEVRYTQRWVPGFLHFLTLVKISSKELTVPGPIVPYEGQLRFLAELDEGLSMDQHLFVVLKSRQLGISTIMLALDIFWLFMFPGLQGALIADTDENRQDFRITITQMLDSLPFGFKIPVATHNRAGLVLKNGSRLRYMAAGKGKNPDLGRSKGLNFVHGTEVATWGDQDGFRSLIDSLSTTNPHRLYVFESTARGHNVYFDVHSEAKRNPNQRAMFIGWWAKHLNSMAKTDPDFERWWGSQPVLNDQEEAMGQLIEEDYGVKLTPEQWAWWRREGSIRSEQNLLQEHPWHERVAFQETGHSFFNLRRINEDMDLLHRGLVTYDGYRYEMGNNFLTMRCDKVLEGAQAELRIYEGPVKNARYAIGVDVAFGRSDTNDRHSIQIFRCFADRLVQVAEWTTSIPETRQVAWVLAHLAGSYRDCMINLEVSGPGLEVMTQMRMLRQDIEFSHLLHSLEATFDAKHALDQARWFLYHRPDTPGQGYMYNWKCLALDTPIPTPSGWATMGELAAGDTVFDERGQPCTVLGISPVKRGAKCFRITFDDGSHIVADEDHLWSVHRPHWGQTDKLRKTSQLRAGQHTIRVAGPLKNAAVDLPIDPYVLGVWLGDGYSQSASFCASPDDMPAISAALEAAGATLGEPRLNGTVMRRAITGLRAKLAANGLLQNKHIPVAYLRGSYEQRVALLQGLMDTDGSAAKKAGGQCSFTTSNQPLAAHFAVLVRSLGMKAKFIVRRRKIKTSVGEVDCAVAWQFGFTPPAGIVPFRLPRKAAVMETRPIKPRPHHHRIVKIEKVRSVPVKCILVDSPSHLFLAGVSMIPTHNTNHDNKQEMFNGFRDAYSTDQVIIRSSALLGEMVTLRQNGVSIGAMSGKKDDRPFAAGLACYAWRTWIRLNMMQEGRTYDREMRLQESRKALGENVIEGLIPQFFARKEAERKEAYLQQLLGN